MKYSEEYMQSHDIDWFCKINELPVHLASNSGVIPEFANDRKNNVNNQTNAYNSSYQFEESEIQINESYINHLFDIETNMIDKEHKKEMYLRSFVDMARRGYISMDRVNKDIHSKNYFHDSRYVVVAWPPIINEKRIVNSSFTIDEFEYPNFNDLKYYDLAVNNVKK